MINAQPFVKGKAMIRQKDFRKIAQKENFGNKLSNF